jgi:hypothetical protein
MIERLPRKNHGDVHASASQGRSAYSEVDEGGILPRQPKFTDDWEKERKKIKTVSLVGLVALAVIVILFAISLVRTLGK